MILPVVFLLFSIGLVASGQYAEQYAAATTPVPILKQINKHNGDGSYSYGYEAADGSYKIESKYPTGEVYGKYGFVDDTGNVREIEYGASRRGFEPAGPGINVPPPTLTGNSITGSNEPEDDGQYKEDPSIYYTDPRYTNGERYDPMPYRRNKLPAYNRPQQVASSYAHTVSRYPTPVKYQPQMAVSQRFDARYRPQYRPQYRSQFQPSYQGQQQEHSLYAASPPIPGGHQGQAPSNIPPDAGLASYTVQYRR